MAGYAFLIAHDGEQVVGFGSLSPIHRAATLRRAAQLAYFLAPECTGENYLPPPLTSYRGTWVEVAITVGATASGTRDRARRRPRAAPRHRA